MSGSFVHRRFLREESAKRPPTTRSPATIASGLRSEFDMRSRFCGPAVLRRRSARWTQRSRRTPRPLSGAETGQCRHSPPILASRLESPEPRTGAPGRSSGRIFRVDVSSGPTFQAPSSAAVRPWGRPGWSGSWYRRPVVLPSVASRSMGHRARPLRRHDRLRLRLGTGDDRGADGVGDGRGVDGTSEVGG